jgi:ATP-dependent helicase HrpA
MHLGTRRLLLLTCPSPRKYVSDRLGNAAQLSLLDSPHGSVGGVLDDATLAAVAFLMAHGGGPVWDEAAFQSLRDYVAGHLAETVSDTVRLVVRVLDAAREVRRRLDALPASESLADARRDIASQLGRLVFPGFISATGVARLADVERYLNAAAQRLERLPNAVAVDRDRMHAVQELEDRYRRRLETLPRGAAVDPELGEVPWMLEELRVSHFAQALGTRGQVSNKRIRRVLDAAGAY